MGYYIKYCPTLSQYRCDFWKHQKRFWKCIYFNGKRLNIRLGMGVSSAPFQFDMIIMTFGGPETSLGIWNRLSSRWATWNRPMSWPATWQWPKSRLTSRRATWERLAFKSGQVDWRTDEPFDRELEIKWWADEPFDRDLEIDWRAGEPLDRDTPSRVALYSVVKPK